MCDGAWEKAEDGMWFSQWEVATEIEECGDDGTPRPPSRRSYYPAPSPPARLVPMPKFSLPQAGTETLTTSTPPPRTSQRASRVRSQSPIRRVLDEGMDEEWTTSRYSTRLRKECLTSWWTLLYQVWQISFENEVVTRSRDERLLPLESAGSGISVEVSKLSVKMLTLLHSSASFCHLGCQGPTSICRKGVQSRMRKSSINPSG